MTINELMLERELAVIGNNWTVSEMDSGRARVEVNGNLTVKQAVVFSREIAKRNNSYIVVVKGDGLVKLFDL